MSKSFTKALFAGLLLNLLLLPAGLALTDSSYIASSAHEGATRDMLKQLRTRHYVKQELDDAFSSKLLDAYLDDLDPNRQFLLKADVTSFEKYRHQLDNQIKAYKLSAGFTIFKRYQQRINNQLERTIRDLPATLASFDYSRDDQILIDRSEAPWPKDQAEANAIWLQQLKNRSLSLKLAGKKDDEIATLLKKRYSNQLKRLTQLESEDIFQTYANAITSLYDPHTDYFSPRISENFQINMSLKLEGIGAVLQMEDDYTKIVRLVPAGPADKQGELQPADRIIGVAQGYDTEMSDVVGWRLDDVVDLIRGPAGSIVRLNVIPASSQNEETHKEIIIERNEVKLEDQSAKGELLEITEADGKVRKVGVIDIPTFYLDFEAYRNRDPNYRSTTSDVSRILSDLLAQGAEGIIIDLRDNGGGSLAEASGLVGLFIESGPTVLIRQSNAKIIPEGKRRPSAFYDGPLLVFINRMSASASEIFAGAIQDYKRGLVIGTQSFGKGTVQSVNALSHGQLKLTESKFYRVSGDSTQNRGVIPDILFPALYDKENIGESILDNALHWDQIRTARHQKYYNFDTALPQLKVLHEERSAADPDFIFLNEQISEIQKLRKKTTLSLNIERRKADREQQKKLQLAMENRRRVAQGKKPLEKLDDDELSTLTNEEGGTAASSGDEKDKDDAKKPDPMLIEAGRILIDTLPIFQSEKFVISR